MTVLHVRTQGAVVHREQERIKVTLADKATRRRSVLSSEPVHNLEQLVVYGNVQVTTQAASLLLEHRIDVVFLSLFGAYRGRLACDGSRAAQARLLQLRATDNPRQTLQIATDIVRAKTTGQCILLRQLADQTNSSLSTQLLEAGRGIERMRNAVSRSGTLDAVRGHEGKASAFYFGALRLWLDPAWSFQGRAYHPPPDPFNALLSFGYTLLAKDIERIVQLVGLDPYIGFLHGFEENRPSLVLDLMEEFRPAVVDWAMLDLVLRRPLKPDAFTFTGRKDRPVELGADLIPAVVEAYESRCDDVVQYRPSDNRQTLRNCMELQTRMLSRVIQGKRQRYEGIL